MEPATDTRQLEVRAREIRGCDGWTVTEFTVDCPFRVRSVDLDDCEQCAAYEGYAAGEGGRPAAVQCDTVKI